MRVLIATHFFPPGHHGGTEAYTFGLAQALRQHGHSPFVICAEDWGTGPNWVPAPEDTVYAGIPVRRLRWNWRLAPRPFVSLYDNAEVERHFAGYVRQLEPDVVHVTSCYTLGARIIRASRQAGIPTLLTLTDFWFLCPRHTLLRGDGSLCEGPESAVGCLKCLSSGVRAYRALTAVLPSDVVAGGLLAVSRWPWIRLPRGLRGSVGDAMARLAFLRREFEHVDVALAPSQFLIDVFVRYGYPVRRFRLWPYGLDTSWLSSLRPREAEARPRVGYIGQIDPIKGVHLLVEAFQSLSGQVSGELRIYGDLAKNPRYGEKLRGVARRNPDIRFMGPFERSQIADVLSELDIVAVPSVWYENAPVVITEAFAARKPVIATNLPGMGELVEHGVNGLLFERGDVSGLASAIRLLVGDSALRGRLRDGVKPVRTVEQEVKELSQLYESAVERAEAPFDPLGISRRRPR